MKKLSIIAVVIAAVAVLVVTGAFASDWEGPLEDWVPFGPSSLLVEFDDENKSTTVTVPEGDVWLEAYDADPEWISCDPPLRETWLQFEYNGTVDPVPLEDTDCPERPEGNKWYVKHMVFPEDTPVTIRCGEDSCHAAIWIMARPVETPTPTTESTATVTVTSTRGPSKVLFPIMRLDPTMTPTPTSTPTSTPTPSPTPTKEPKIEQACSRFNLEQSPNGATPAYGTYNMVEVGTGRLLVQWFAEPGWEDSGWKWFDISYNKSHVEVWFDYQSGGSVKLDILNPAPGTQYGWVARGTCHAVEVAFPGG